MHPRSGRRVRIVDDESKRGAARWSSAPGERRRDVRAVAGVFDRDRRSFFERRAGERERHTSPLMPRRCKREQDDEDAVLRRGRVPHERNIKPKPGAVDCTPGLTGRDEVAVDTSAATCCILPSDVGPQVEIRCGDCQRTVRPP